jgi:GNAT superfamily N-acetyltransferase
MQGLKFEYVPYGERHQVFAMEDDYAVAFIEWKAYGNVTLVYVTHGYRRMGVGTQLLDHAIHCARKRGIQQPTYSDSYTPAGTALMHAYTGEYHEPTLNPDDKVKVAA